MICMKCGKQNPDGVSQCVVCGEALILASQEPVVENNITSAPVQKPLSAIEEVIEEADTDDTDKTVALDDATPCEPVHKDEDVTVPVFTDNTSEENTAAPVYAKAQQNQAVPVYTNVQNYNSVPVQNNAPIYNSTPVNNAVPMYNNYTAQNYSQQASVSGAVAAIKKLGSSPLFLILTILFSVSILVSILSSVFGTNQITALILNVMYEMGVPSSDLNEVAMVMGSGVNVFSIISSILGSIPSILIAIGLWMCYSAASNKRSPIFKTSGLTMIKVIEIINLVLTCIAALFSLIVLIIALISVFIMAGGMGFEGEAALSMGIMVLLFLLIAAIITFSIVFQAKIISTLSNVANSARTNTYIGNASAFVAVILFIYAIMPLLTGIFTIIFVPLLGITGLIGAVCNILAGILIFQYRGAVKNAMLR